jgi:hypothetical protein
MPSTVTGIGVGSNNNGLVGPLSGGVIGNNSTSGALGSAGNKSSL